MSVGVIVCQYFPVAQPLLGEHISTILTHADTVPVSGYMKGEGTVSVFDGECSGAQGEGAAKLSACQLFLTYLNALYASAFVYNEIGKPFCGLCGKIKVGVFFA